MAASITLGTTATRVAGQARRKADRPAPAQAPSFRAGVDVVSLNVTVTDGTARYITDLQEENFSVFEDGIKQDVTLFSRTNLPIALALLLDTSASMETKLPVAQEAAVGFAKRLRNAGSRRNRQLRQPRRRAPDLHQQRRRARAGDSQDLAPAARRRCTTPSTSR